MSNLIRSFNTDFKTLVEQQQNSPALIDGRGLNTKVISYKELETLVNRTISFLQSQGIESGQTILSLMPNAIETLVLFFAALKGAYNFAPLPCTATQIELEHWIQLTKPSICFTTDLINDADKQALLTLKIETVLVETDSRFNWLPHKTEFKETLAPASIYLSTSGTTGEPKAIVIDSEVLWSSGYAFAQHHNILGEKLTFWNFLPMSYLGGLFNLAIIPLCTGGSVVVDEPFNGKTFLQFWPFIDRFDIDTLWLVPTIIRGLLILAERTGNDNALNYKDKIKHCFLGTAPIDLSTKEMFHSCFGILPLENFALSETTFISSEAKQVDNRVEGSVGEILPYVDIKLLPVLSQENTAHKEIYVKSPFLFSGYLQKNGEISIPFDNEGYLATGDLGLLNDNNTLIITGRSRDIIKKGGYFISLREIEILTEQHDSIAEAVAVQTEHEFYGESYLLFIQAIDPSLKNIKNELSSWLHINLIQYKWPEKVILVDDFPRTASGKVKKHTLIEQVG